MSSLVKDIKTTDISEFQNELDRKDLIIKNLQNQLVNIKSQGQSLSSNNHIISELKSECLRKDREIQILNEKIFELSTELKEANAKLDCYELKENFNKNESGNLLEISEIKIDKISKEKKLLEEKINQLNTYIMNFPNIFDISLVNNIAQGTEISHMYRTVEKNKKINERKRKENDLDLKRMKSGENQRERSRSRDFDDDNDMGD